LPAPLKVHLSETEDRELLEFQKIEGIPSRVRERAEIVRLNHYGWSVAAIAEYKNKSPHTVRNSLHRWSIQGFEGLWEKEGRGRKPKWKKEDIEYIENCLEKEQRTYNASQLSQKLAKERGVTLSSDRLRKVLKKRGGVGRGQDINNHQLMTPNKKKRNESI
jgi:transposase